MVYRHRNMECPVKHVWAGHPNSLPILFITLGKMMLSNSGFKCDFRGQNNPLKKQKIAW